MKYIFIILTSFFPNLKLIIVDLHSSQQITIAELVENVWFKKGFTPHILEQQDVSLAAVDVIFIEVGDVAVLVVEKRDERPGKPLRFVCSNWESITSTKVHLVCLMENLIKIYKN
ncbi:CBL-interacting protein kinase 23-like [Bidens hawaiensis]|uniref:CBL-interacting protein kinase 23-like n=1 Tax=Bidens hawaiensis TaxID=980011 RepID=UPI004049BF80